MSQGSGSATGWLSTHVLDTATGLPAAALKIELFHVDGDRMTLIRTIETNDDGRTDAPLLRGDEMAVGEYQLVFHAGDYLRKLKLDLAEPLFLDRVPLRFGIADPAKHYHVPLLLSPFSYSTYRGS